MVRIEKLVIEEKETNKRLNAIQYDGENVQELIAFTKPDDYSVEYSNKTKMYDLLKLKLPGVHDSVIISLHKGDFLTWEEGVIRIYDTIQCGYFFASFIIIKDEEVVSVELPTEGREPLFTPYRFTFADRKSVVINVHRSEIHQLIHSKDTFIKLGGGQGEYHNKHNILSFKEQFVRGEYS